MKVSPIISVVSDFFRRTTLHGFKYLGSKYCYDRMVWLMVCCASACSAGVLCAVLWGRFIQQPAIVALRDLKDLSVATSGMPLIVVCPPAEFIAGQVVAQFQQAANESDKLTSALARVIRKKMAEEEHLKLLDQYLDEHRLNLPDALMQYSPSCEDVIVSCRWQNKLVSSAELFEKQFTDFGLCCVLSPDRLQAKSKKRLFDPLETTRRLDLALACNKSTDSNYGCEVLPIYHGDENLVPHMLHRGLSYWLQVTFTTTLDTDGSLLNANDGCVPDDGYSRLLCVTRCIEDVCGCSDPLQAATSSRNAHLPRCSVTQLNCLRSSKAYENSSCICSPSCTKFTTDTAIETNTMDFINYTFDPLYQELNPSVSNIVYIRVRLRQSKVFFLLPTETWLTLLSSLGGVFNMFLGVGLFSALEFLFLVIFKLPLALRKTAEINIPVDHYH